MSRATYRRRVAFYTSTQGLSGLEKNALQLMNWFKEVSIESILIANDASAIYSKANSSGIPCVSIPASTSYLSLKIARNLADIVKRQKVDLLIIIKPRDILLSGLMKNLFHRKLKLVFLQQANFNLKNHPALYRILFRPFNAWVCPTTNILKKNQKLTRYNKSKMLVIPPGIDTDHITTDTVSKAAARKILALPENKFIVGITGVCNPKFRADFLIRMVQFLKHNHHHIELAIAGSITNEEESEYLCFLKELTIECNIESQVHFIPYSEKLITFLRALDVFVMNQDRNQFSLLMLKAMAAGTTVLANYSEYNTSLLEKGKYGILYKNNDLEDFASKIIHLLTQPIIHTHLQAMAKKQVSACYDRKVLVKKHKVLFDSLAEE